MGRLYKFWCQIVALLFLFASTPILFHTAPAAAAVNWQAGANITPTYNNDFSSDQFHQSLRNLAAIHANAVSLVIYYYQDNIYSANLHPGGNTPTDDSLSSAVNFAHSLGLQVTLKIHTDPNDGNWRANVNPGDRAGWFASYQSMLVHYAHIAQQTGAEVFCIGQEMIDMTSPQVNGSNTGYWQGMIGAVRSIYSGKLSYGANAGAPGFTDEVSVIGFWGSLDYVGVSAYVPLSQDNNPSIESMTAAFAAWEQNEIRPVIQRTGKPLVITEMGYRSMQYSYKDPTSWQANGAADEAGQARSYQAVFNYLLTVPYLAGAYVWEWETNPNAGWPGSTSYTPQNKQAQGVLSNVFNGQGGSTGSPGFAVATAHTGSTNHTPVSLNVSVRDKEAAAQGILVDVEVYNQQNQRVFQQVYEGQNFGLNEQKSYQSQWVPNGEGTYKVKVGVFSSGWGSNYVWNDSADTVVVSRNVLPPPPPPPGNTIDIWWPSNGSSVRGVQPFKVLLKDAGVDSYAMYWQVDGGQLNIMSSNQQDYPHKEVLVDVSGWNWRGSGPYEINFVAKSANGVVLAQKSARITIQR